MLNYMGVYKLPEKIILSEDDILYAINKFNTQKDASTYLGVSPPTLRNALRKMGLHWYDNGIVRPDINKGWLIERWVNTDKSLADIANAEGVSEGMLGYRAKKYGLTKQFKHHINDNKLKDVSDPDACYLAGLIATDGYVNTNAQFVSLTMVGDSEKQLLADILKCFDSSDVVHPYANGYKCSIRISCDGYKQFLMDEFCIPSANKTANVGVPKSFVSEDCAKAYVLGCIDGDGCISHLNKGQSPTIVLLTQSEQFVCGVADIVERYTGVSFHRLSSGKRKYPSIALSGKRDVLKVLEWMYSSTSRLRLSRKYDKFLRVKDIVCSAMNAK